MNNVPNFDELRKAQIVSEAKALTIACQACKAPLWTISEFIQYGDRKDYKNKIPFDGVPEYNAIWSKDRTSCSEVLCWFCGEPWMKVIEAKGKYFPKPFILELDE